MKKNILLLILLFLFIIPNKIYSQSIKETYDKSHGKSTTKKCYLPNDSTLVVVIDNGDGNELEQYFHYDKDGDNVYQYFIDAPKIPI